MPAVAIEALEVEASPELLAIELMKHLDKEVLAVAKEEPELQEVDSIKKPDLPEVLLEATAMWQEYREVEEATDLHPNADTVKTSIMYRLVVDVAKDLTENKAKDNHSEEPEVELPEVQKEVVKSKKESLMKAVDEEQLSKDVAEVLLALKEVVAVATDQHILNLEAEELGAIMISYHVVAEVAVTAITNLEAMVIMYHAAEEEVMVISYLEVGVAAMVIMYLAAEAAVTAITYLAVEAVAMAITFLAVEVEVMVILPLAAEEAMKQETTIKLTSQEVEVTEAAMSPGDEATEVVMKTVVVVEEILSLEEAVDMKTEAVANSKEGEEVIPDLKLMTKKVNKEEDLPVNKEAHLEVEDINIKNQETNTELTMNLLQLQSLKWVKEEEVPLNVVDLMVTIKTKPTNSKSRKNTLVLMDATNLIKQEKEVITLAQLKTPIIILKLRTKSLLQHVQPVIMAESSDLSKITSLPTGMTSMFSHLATNRISNSAKNKKVTSLTTISVETDAVVVVLKAIKREETTVPLVNTNIINLATTSQIKDTKVAMKTAEVVVEILSQEEAVEVSKNVEDSAETEEDLLKEAHTEATAAIVADTVEEKEAACKCVAEETITTDLENKKTNQKTDHKSPSSINNEEETSVMCSKRSAKRKTAASLG